MRIFAFCLFVVALSAACTKHNPNSCCRTQEQCDTYGLDGVTACEAGRTCDDTGSCVASQCSTSADCTSADLPICENQLCIAKCSSDDECVGLDGRPHCASDGVCVGCIDDTSCSATAPVCDQTARSCRGCSKDAECDSDVCLAVDGTCADPSAIIWVSSLGVDSGGCTLSSKCLTVGFAAGVASATRNVVHLEGGTVSSGISTIPLAKKLYIDGGGVSTIHRAATVVFDVMALGQLTLDRVSVDSGPDTALKIEPGGNVRLHKSTMSRTPSGSEAVIVMTGGALDVFESTFGEPTVLGHSAVECSNGGVVRATNTTFNNLSIYTSACELKLEQNRFDEHDAALDVTGGTVTVENNVFTSSYEFADSSNVQAVATGSVIRFNTWANTSSAEIGGVALQCDSTSTVSSNIFVWGSNNSACAAAYSLYDATGTGTSTNNNHVADKQTIFRDLAGKDFHLAASSPARGAADPAQSVVVDFDGNQRPNPAGSAPDEGAFEAP